jgi:hypothetical protein
VPMQSLNKLEMLLIMLGQDEPDRGSLILYNCNLRISENYNMQYGYCEYRLIRLKDLGSVRMCSVPEP